MISSLLLGLGCAFIIVHVVRCYFFHPLASVPGPLMAKSGLWSWRTMHVFRRDFGYSLLEAHAKYGSVVRIGHNEVSFADATEVPQIYGTTQNLFKGKFYRAFVPKSSHAPMGITDPKKHAEEKKVTSHGFAPRAIGDLEQYVGPVIENLVTVLQDACQRSDGVPASVEFNRLANFFAKDAVGELAFGARFDMLKKQDDGGMSKIIDDFLFLGVFTGTQANAILPLIHFLLDILPNPFADFLALVDSIQEQRRADIVQGKHVRPDMMTKLIEGSIEAGRPASPLQISTNAAANVAAGSDTVSNFLCALLAEIIGDADIYSALEAEIDQALALDTSPTDWTSSDAKGKLPLLQACIQEALRLHPPNHYLLPRDVGLQGYQLGKYFLLPGVQVAASPFVTGRDAEVFGEKTDEFRPKRWLEASAEDLKRMERCTLAFGVGSRICPGRHIALMEINKLLPVLLRRFRFRPTPRIASSPHRHPLGTNRVTGRKDKCAPYIVESSWFGVVKDQWIDVTVRQT